MKVGDRVRISLHHVRAIPRDDFRSDSDWIDGTITARNNGNFKDTTAFFVKAEFRYPGDPTALWILKDGGCLLEPPDPIEIKTAKKWLAETIQELGG